LLRARNHQSGLDLTLRLLWEAGKQDVWFCLPTFHVWLALDDRGFLLPHSRGTTQAIEARLIIAAFTRHSREKSK
jgi:hypothetical protein